MTLSLPPATKSRSESPSNIVKLYILYYRVKLKHKKMEEQNNIFHY